jgi:hypothetical protein
MAAGVKNIFVGRIRNWTCPKVLSVYRPPDAVSLPTLILCHLKT